MIRVFLVDDNEIVRRAIAQLVESEPDLTVVGEAATCDAAVPRIAATTPDVAVLDLQLPDGSGINLCRDIRSTHPTVGCLILTAYDDDEALRSAVLAGAHGYVIKEIRSFALIDAIRRAAKGSAVQPAHVLREAGCQLRQDRHDDPTPALSSDESHVLDLVVEGLTNSEIAKRLGLAEATARDHVIEVLAKLGVPHSV